MKKLSILFILFATFLNAQNSYKKISEKKISQERKMIAKNFINEYLTKCSNKDYSEFQNFNLSKRMEIFIKEELKNSCEKSEKIYGDMKLLNFDSAYIHKRSINSDPLELFVFEAKTEKDPLIKYMSVWIFQDKNYINGIWFSIEKPLNSKK